jgi:hypothetical protein
LSARAPFPHAASRAACWLALLAALLIVLPVPRAQAEDWFDAYDEGLRLMARAQPARAAERLERAARLRPEPGTNLLTYGTNRLRVYHPYLRLAEAYLQAGDRARALEALARSAARGAEPADERERLRARVEALPGPQSALASTAPVPLPTAPVLVAPTPAASSAPLVVSTPPPANPTGAPTAPPSAPVRALTGRLELDSDPPGARVFVDGRLLGLTPVRLDLPSGQHVVTLQRDGYAEQRFDVTLAAGARVGESRALVPTAQERAGEPASAAGPGTLIVYVQPTDARVSVDEGAAESVDRTTGRLLRTGLTPGRHLLRVQAPGHGDSQRSFEIQAGQPTTLDVRLAPTSGPPSWSWPVIALTALVLLTAGTMAFARRGRARAEGAAAPVSAVSGTGATQWVAPATTAPTALQTTESQSSVPTAVPPPTQPEGATSSIEMHALAGLVPDPHLATFGEYRVLEALGRGGMASVHKAERHGEFVALKRPLPAFIDEPEFLQRFAREADIGRTLHHPNIVRILDRGTVDNTPYFTMELVVGDTLSAHVRRTGALTPVDAVRVVAQIAEALDYAHLKGVVHRDLKPSNVMIRRDGMVKVMDYGIARARRFEGLTLTGHFLGTPEYVAPETVEGKGTDARSDLYALGVIFYELLVGRRPFVADTPFALLRKHCVEPPVPPCELNPACPPELEAIDLRLLAKDPAMRHPSAEDLLIELRDYLNRIGGTRERA